MTEPKYRRMSSKAVRWILKMIRSGEWKGSEIADLFGISRSRVSQIKSEYTKEEAESEEAAPAP